MQFQINQLHFAAPSIFVWLALLFLAAIGFYCITAFRRAARPVCTGLLEFLRSLIVLYLHVITEKHKLLLLLKKM